MSKVTRGVLKMKQIDEVSGQISIDDILENRSIKHGKKWDLPGFSEARSRLEEARKNPCWIDEVVDPTENDAVFVKNGKPWYKSNCPEYDGFWICGGIGSVQCKVHDGLIPGLHFHLTCGKNPEKCPLRVFSGDRRG